MSKISANIAERDAKISDAAKDIIVLVEMFRKPDLIYGEALKTERKIERLAERIERLVR